MAKHQALADVVSNVIRNSPLTQSEIAQRLGTTDANVSRWKNGGSSPAPEFWAAIETLFDIPTGDLEAAAYGTPRLPAEISALPQLVEALTKRVEALEAAAAKSDHPTGRKAPNVVPITEPVLRRAAKKKTPRTPD